MTGIVIVGGGLAAGRAARKLREENYANKITLLAGEPHMPYQRPPLSKGYLQGTEGLDKVLLQPDSWYSDNSIEVRTATPATRINPRAHELTISTGETLGYDKLLLATGSSARTLPIEGHDLAGVHTLRTLDDANTLLEAMKDGGKQLVLIGSGWIGMEVAASARALGNSVTILEKGKAPLEMALGSHLGGEFQKLHEEHGVVFHMSANVEKIAGDGHVTGVVADGKTIPADLVLVGVGAIPNTQLAVDARLDVYNGILTNSSFLTSAPDVYAAGDVANAYHPVIHRHMRSEHWSNAINTGKAAALAMLGHEVSYDEIPYFYTDQYDLGMELSGYIPLMSGAEIMIRGDLAARKYVAFWVDHGRVVAGMNVNIWDVNDHVQGLIRSGSPVDTDALIDPNTPLESLISA